MNPVDIKFICVHMNSVEPYLQRTNRKGRPKLHLRKELLLFLKDTCKLTTSKIAKLLSLSPKTVTRRLRELSLRSRDLKSDISNNELKDVVYGLCQLYPHAGYRMIRSMLSIYGISLPRTRIRRAVREVDPLGVASRLSGSIKRRTYFVREANFLWHLDGNMKLIRWGFVIHGCIDGYSRLITFLNCSSNNKADTVFQLFISAVETFGLPLRCRGDKGGENSKVARFMRSIKDISSFIAGRSVHNQRIERLWRDTYAMVVHRFQELFYLLEECGLLDLTDEIQVFALNLVFLPRINHALPMFAHSWNHHPMSTEHNMTPSQMWVLSMLQQGFTDIAFLNQSVQYFQEMTGQNLTNLPHFSRTSRIYTNVIEMMNQALFEDLMILTSHQDLEDDISGMLLYNESVLCLQNYLLS